MARASHKQVGRPSLAAHEPLPEHVAGSKGGPWYTSHTYPTKVPPEAIKPFIEASTVPGGLVADPFCGSGMTGVAAVLVGRRAALSDLSPGAVHLARQPHTTPVPRAADRGCRCARPLVDAANGTRSLLVVDRHR